MPGEVLPSSIRQFIWLHVSSIEQMEILQLLATRPGTDWTAQAVYKVVLTTPGSVEQALEKFTNAGFIEKTSGVPPSWRFAVTGGMADVIADLCKHYAEMPVRVIAAIYQDRSTVQEFADAFKFKREP